MHLLTGDTPHHAAVPWALARKQSAVESRSARRVCHSHPFTKYILCAQGRVGTGKFPNGYGGDTEAYSEMVN